MQEKSRKSEVPLRNFIENPKQKYHYYTYEASIGGISLNSMNITTHHDTLCMGEFYETITLWHLMLERNIMFFAIGFLLFV